ncbi:chemotaxis protein CheD [Pontibacillus salicampi]|uniref:Probable chemoreceptor glutamine deamidase CheD n=1 Tax=Pontibacillus salicampi TaxID=1449801 RepID=A0ABV6LPC6_9BACI
MNETATIIKVGIADLNIVKPPNKIKTSGLGSCVGIILYDGKRKLGGMAHIMLPSSEMARETIVNEAKYADTAIPLLIKKLSAIGGRKSALTAKLAGGAQMFPLSPSSTVMRIGPRNVESVKKQLSRYSIPLIAEDSGGHNGRTIEFDPEQGTLEIRTVNKGVSTI